MSHTALLADANPLHTLYYDPFMLRQAVRQALKSLLDSYHSPVDVLGEPIQNAVDEVTRPGATRPGVVEVIIDSPGNSIEVQDNGRGMTSAQVQQFLAPNVTGKAEAFRRGETRGHKGVGLTYLSYGFAEILIESWCEATGEHFAYRMRDARAWVMNDDAEAEDPVLEPLDASIHVLRGPGLRIRVTLSGLIDASAGVNVKTQTVPHTVGEYLPDPKYAVTMLETATAIGVLARSTGSSPAFDATLTYIDATGATGEKTLSTHYRYPHKNTGNKIKTARLSTLADGEECDAVYEHYDTDALVTMLQSSTGRGPYSVSQMVDALRAHRMTAYAMRGASARVRDEIGRAWGVDESRLKDKGELHAPRIALGTDGMISTWRRTPTLTHKGFSVDRVWIIFHGEGIQPDMGRKEFPPIIQEIVTRLQEEVANRIDRDARGHLYTDDRDNDTARGESLSTRVGNKRTQAWDDRELVTALGVTLKCPPDNEQETVALYSQLAAKGGPLAHLAPLLLHPSDKYDSYFEYDHTYPVRPDVEFRLPGKAGGRSAEGWAEFKYHAATLAGDLRTGIKNFADMKFLVCWEIGAPTTKVGADLLTFTEADSASARRFPGVTHLAKWTGAKDHTIYVVSMRDLIRILGEEDEA